ncbi:DUF5060 domain-containing protein [Paraglaciecola aquimarina]|uniref:DUF5060 domain-containing protein n=1 Tax=Paraglaciecola aquimarina TaxID=1235557 RepID=A0ABU3SWT6_9ALTE|nr:DUF5060 domain-containing protein [Paraglaciecola aquimarina]MDU0354481.1 DUF5060 domain-containing protein [Paraglaciecola aquimarina]
MTQNKFNRITFLILLILLGKVSNALADTEVEISGELRKWHGVSLTFDGPDVSENDEYNPFVNYRLNVEFTHKPSGSQYLVPGYFAADGDAGNTSASSGNKWRVNFSADQEGQWTWHATFRKGAFVAVSNQPNSGVSAGFMDNQKGAFEIKPSNKSYPDFRARGRLEYINQPYLRFAQTGEYFIKAGPDAPENLLSYADFDGTFHDDGHKDNLVKTWQPHLKDWKKGDPTWKQGKGKALIGALNYLSQKGMNSISFLTLNIGGDDQNVFPYIDYDTYDRMDISKLEQWNVIFTHAQQQGLFLHFKTSEVENQGLLDNGGLGLHRQLYYRELIARFGHHLALNWNMGEENGEWVANHKTMPQSTIQRLAMAKYFYNNDPYHHHVVIHNGNDYDDLTGPDSYYTGASVQTGRKDFANVHGAVKRLREWPLTNGRPFAVSVDEPGDAQDSLLPDSVNAKHDNARMNGLWGALTAGAWGTEWYFGYAHPHSDLTAQDWRSRDLFWEQAKHALDFFKMADVPYHKAKNLDNLSNGHWVLGEEGQFYIVFVKHAKKSISLNFYLGMADYSVQWYNPRTGGKLQTGSIDKVYVTKPRAGYKKYERHELGTPPSDDNQDWVILVKRN